MHFNSVVQNCLRFCGHLARSIIYLTPPVCPVGLSSVVSTSGRRGCSPCPAHSTTNSSDLFCECVQGYYRNQMEDGSVPCSSKFPCAFHSLPFLSLPPTHPLPPLPPPLPSRPFPPLPSPPLLPPPPISRRVLSVLYLNNRMTT